jgi:hypothetical protein
LTAGRLIELDARSLAVIENFLGVQTGAAVELGRVRLATGWLGNGLTAVARARAITFGRIIFLDRATARALLEAIGPAEVGDGVCLATLGGLLVHECGHVWQYRRFGWTRFLVSYVWSYVSQLRRLGISAEARLEAYRSIPFEAEARRFGESWDG